MWLHVLLSVCRRRMGNLPLLSLVCSRLPVPQLEAIFKPVPDLEQAASSPSQPPRAATSTHSIFHLVLHSSVFWQLNTGV